LSLHPWIMLSMWKRELKVKIWLVEGLPLTLTRLMPQQMDERREKGLCFDYDSKYIRGNKCDMDKLFYVDCKKEEE
jgi:hypothetical protein